MINRKTIPRTAITGVSIALLVIISLHFIFNFNINVNNTPVNGNNNVINNGVTNYIYYNNEINQAAKYINLNTIIQNGTVITGNYKNNTIVTFRAPNLVNQSYVGGGINLNMVNFNFCAGLKYSITLPFLFFIPQSSNLSLELIGQLYSPYGISNVTIINALGNQSIILQNRTFNDWTQNGINFGLYSIRFEFYTTNCMNIGTNLTLNAEVSVKKYSLPLFSDFYLTETPS